METVKAKYDVKADREDCDCGPVCRAAIEALDSGAGESDCPRVYPSAVPRVVDLATREPVTRPTAVAASLVDGDRQTAYGHPLPNHQRIAAYWTVRLFEKLRPGCVVEPHEAAAMMRLAKEARLTQTPGHPDSLTDVAGYADVEHAIHAAYGTEVGANFSRLFEALRDTREGR